MNDIILISYLEDGKPKTKIVKDSQKFWLDLLDKFQQQYKKNASVDKSPKKYKNNAYVDQKQIKKWQKEKQKEFDERVIEHTTYWIMVEKEKKLIDKDTFKKLFNELNFCQQLDLLLDYINLSSKGRSILIIEVP